MIAGNGPSGLGVLAREVAVARILTLPHPPTEIEPSRRVHRSRRTEERGPIRSAAGCRHLVQTHTFCFTLFLLLSFALNTFLLLFDLTFNFGSFVCGSLHVVLPLLLLLFSGHFVLALLLG